MATKTASQFRIELPIELNNGNTGRGSKWFSSSKIRKEIETVLRVLGLVMRPVPVPVVLRITRVLGPRQSLWDSDSIGRGNAKELIDAMVACGWFHDDGPEYITETQFSQSRERAEKPAVIVEVWPSDAPVAKVKKPSKRKAILQ